MLGLEKKEDAGDRKRRVALRLPPRRIVLPNREPLCRMRISRKQQLITCSQGGKMAVWSSTPGLEPAVSKEQLQIGEDSGPLAGSRPRHRWVTDFVEMPHIHKCAVASGEREIWFLEMGTLAPQFAVCCGHRWGEGGLQLFPMTRFVFGRSRA